MRFKHFVIAIVLGVSIIGAVAMGWFAGLENGMRDIGFASMSRPASGDIVFIEIDTESMRDVHSSGGLRRLYAWAIREAVDADARHVVLDVPLPQSDDYFADNALIAALSQGYGTVRTVAILEAREEGEHLAMPWQRFAIAASPVFVDTGETVRDYSTRFLHQGWVVDSLATALSPDVPVKASEFIIDFGIDLDTVPRINIAELAEGHVAPEDIAGKKLVIGHSQTMLQASVVVPRFGLVPTSLRQIAAAETVHQGRALAALGPWPTALLIVLSLAGYVLTRGRFTMGAMVYLTASYMVVIALVAAALYARSGLLLDTLAIHLTQVALLCAMLWEESAYRRHSLTEAARERDTVRGLLSQVVSDNFDGVVVVDDSRQIRAASRFAGRTLGTELIGVDFATVLPQVFKRAIEDALYGGICNPNIVEAVVPANGRQLSVEFVVTISRAEGAHPKDPTKGRVVSLTFRDVSEQHATRERLKFLAQHDALTGTASRVKFVDDVAALLATPLQRATGATLYVIAISRLKVVNDTLGHARGDALLAQVADRLRGLEPKAIARLEGNKFAVLREGLLCEGIDDDYAAKLLTALVGSYSVDDHHAILGARLGMTDSDLSGSDPNVLISHACQALSLATASAGKAAVIFRREMDTRLKTKQDMEIALRAALANEEFVVHYQPQVDLDSGRIIAVEALVRWMHPKLGFISPGEFIPAAEETGLIIELGRWVLNTACAEVASWPKPIGLSVNVSPLQFEYADIVTDVWGALKASGLPADRLDIEITESLLVTETSHITSQLGKLREHGVTISLDDFGTGYSSLSYLGRLPVDKIKIDQGFVRGMPDDTEATAIVRAVLMLSESLGKTVIAEGIETQDQAWLLRLAGCRIGQGYFFARPAPASDIIERLAHDLDDKLTDRIAAT